LPLRAVFRIDIRVHADVSRLAELEKYYAEANMRKVL
jgi:hypothetical protein